MPLENGRDRDQCSRDSMRLMIASNMAQFRSYAYIDCGAKIKRTNLQEKKP